MRCRAWAELVGGAQTGPTSNAQNRKRRATRTNTSEETREFSVISLYIRRSCWWESDEWVIAIIELNSSMSMLPSPSESAPTKMALSLSSTLDCSRLKFKRINSRKSGVKEMGETRVMLHARDACGSNRGDKRRSSCFESRRCSHAAFQTLLWLPCKVLPFWPA